MQILDRAVPLQIVVVDVMRFVVEQHQLAVRGDLVAEAQPGAGAARRRRAAQHARDRGRLAAARASTARLVELVDVGQIERAARRGLIRIVARHDREAPVRLPGRRNQRIGAEDRTAAEIIEQALIDDYIGRDQREALRVVGAPLRLELRVEIGPDDGERHHFGLARAGRHFADVARPAILRRV